MANAFLTVLNIEFGLANSDDGSGVVEDELVLVTGDDVLERGVIFGDGFGFGGPKPLREGFRGIEDIFGNGFEEVFNDGKGGGSNNDSPSNISTFKIFFLSHQ